MAEARAIHSSNSVEPQGRRGACPRESVSVDLLRTDALGGLPGTGRKKKMWAFALGDGAADGDGDAGVHGRRGIDRALA
jgi:hypothetical protein